MTLRKFAKGQDCQLRIPGYCSHDTEKVVWCHVRKGGVAGWGQKPPDLCGIIGCFECHAVIDGVIRTDYTKVEIESMMLDGMVRTMAIVDKHFELVPK